MSFDILLSSDDAPTSAEEGSIKETVADELNVDEAKLKNFAVVQSPTRRRRSLLATSWAVSYVVVVSLADTNLASGAAFQADVFGNMAGDSFISALRTALSVSELLVESVVAVEITRAPTSAPSTVPSPLPSEKPTSMPQASSKTTDDASSGSSPSTSNTDSASSSMLVIALALSGGVAALIVGVGLYLKKGAHSDSGFKGSWGQRAESLTDDGDAFTEHDLGHLELGAGRAQERLNRTSSGAVAMLQSGDIYMIPFTSLKLEAKPFARGGGGEIFRGKYMGQTIAAKHNFSDNEEYTDEFDREVAMLTKLTHPCILSLYGISKAKDGSLFMIMEFCGGGDLAGYYKEDRFDNAAFIKVTSELFSGVCYLHERNVAHRDLKPENGEGLYYY